MLEWLDVDVEIKDCYEFEELSDDDREQLQRFLISRMQTHLNTININ